MIGPMLCIMSPNPVINLMILTLQKKIHVGCILQKVESGFGFTRCRSGSIPVDERLDIGLAVGPHGKHNMCHPYVRRYRSGRRHRLDSSSPASGHSGHPRAGTSIRSYRSLRFLYVDTSGWYSKGHRQADGLIKIARHIHAFIREFLHGSHVFGAEDFMKLKTAAGLSHTRTKRRFRRPSPPAFCASDLSSLQSVSVSDASGPDSSMMSKKYGIHLLHRRLIDFHQSIYSVVCCPDSPYRQNPSLAFGLATSRSASFGGVFGT